MNLQIYNLNQEKQEKPTFLRLVPDDWGGVGVVQCNEDGDIIKWIVTFDRDGTLHRNLYIRSSDFPTDENGQIKLS